MGDCLGGEIGTDSCCRELARVYFMAVIIEPRTNKQWIVRTGTHLATEARRLFNSSFL
jgi:hypothetical protein